MGKISAWLKARRDRNRIPLPPLHWQSFLLIATNLALLAFFVFDGPVVAAMQNMPAIIRSAGSTLTDIGKSGWILFGSAFMFFEALATSRRLDSAKAKFNALYAGQIAFYVFASVALSGLSANLIKRAIGRARPVNFEEWGIFGFSPFAGSARFESFPSGHATTIGALFMVLALLLPRHRLVLTIFAIWLAMTRVMVGAHYPSDVIAGLAYGSWFSLMMAIVFSRYGIVFKLTPGGYPTPRLPLGLKRLPSAGELRTRLRKP
ncbi:MAG: lipid A 1-phosphatase LpxE [Allorhizobium sp.]